MNQNFKNFSWELFWNWYPNLAVTALCHLCKFICAMWNVIYSTLCFVQFDQYVIGVKFSCILLRHLRNIAFGLFQCLNSTIGNCRLHEYTMVSAYPYFLFYWRFKLFLCRIKVWAHSYIFCCEWENVQKKTWVCINPWRMVNVISDEGIDDFIRCNCISDYDQLKAVFYVVTC